MIWAITQGTALNVIDQQGNGISAYDDEWIYTTLSYLQDDAAIWAAPAMEEFAKGKVPFDGEWATFCKEFKAHFEMVDEAIGIKEKLQVPWQDLSIVPKYATQFKELMGYTKYSSADLCDQFYEHLSPRIKDKLVHSAHLTDSLNDLITVASDINVRLHQCHAEREREKRHPGVMTGTTPTQSTSTPMSWAPFAPLNAKPTTMDVDTTCICKKYLQQMCGRCWGCGSTVTPGRKEIMTMTCVGIVRKWVIKRQSI